MQPDPCYESDFYKWSLTQSGLLREGKLSDADIEHIAEEIESMGKSEKRELISRLEVLLMHLLKWQYQPSRRSTSWKNTIRVQRYRIVDHLEDNPSLNSKLDEIMIKAYKRARIEAATETGMDVEAFPEQSPYSFDETMERIIDE
ncbi:MAG: DUF29 domain-containing protein [Desulfobulbaceae bacterium]|nr:DUF29 domain-containing protein [Desulfobulbaceae bacterium]